MTVSPFSILVLYCHILILNLSDERFCDPHPYDSHYVRDYDHKDCRGGCGQYEDCPPRDYDRGYREFDWGPRQRCRAKHPRRRRLHKMMGLRLPMLVPISPSDWWNL